MTEPLQLKRGISHWIHYRPVTDRRSRARRWRDAVAELVILQSEYAQWFEALPENLQEGAAGEALQAIVDLDLDELIAVVPPRGFGARLSAGTAELDRMQPLMRRLHPSSGRPATPTDINRNGWPASIRMPGRHHRNTHLDGVDIILQHKSAAPDGRSALWSASADRPASRHDRRDRSARAAAKSFADAVVPSTIPAPPSLAPGPDRASLHARRRGSRSLSARRRGEAWPASAHHGDPSSPDRPL